MICRVRYTVRGEREKDRNSMGGRETQRERKWKRKSERERDRLRYTVKEKTKRWHKMETWKGYLLYYHYNNELLGHCVSKNTNNKPKMLNCKFKTFIQTKNSKIQHRKVQQDGKFRDLKNESLWVYKPFILFNFHFRKKNVFLFGE